MKEEQSFSTTTLFVVIFHEENLSFHWICFGWKTKAINFRKYFISASGIICRIQRQGIFNPCICMHAVKFLGHSWMLPVTQWQIVVSLFLFWSNNLFLWIFPCAKANDSEYLVFPGISRLLMWSHKFSISHFSGSRPRACP